MRTFKILVLGYKKANKENNLIRKVIKVKATDITEASFLAEEKSKLHLPSAQI